MGITHHSLSKPLQVTQTGQKLKDCNISSLWNGNICLLNIFGLHWALFFNHFHLLWLGCRYGFTKIESKSADRSNCNLTSKRKIACSGDADCRTSCRNVSHCPQQSNPGLQSHDDHAGHSYDVAPRLKSPFTIIYQNDFYCTLETTNRSQVSLTTTDSVWFLFFLFVFLDLMLSSDFMERKDAIDTFNKVRMSWFLRLILLVFLGPDN